MKLIIQAAIIKYVTIIIVTLAAAGFYYRIPTSGIITARGMTAEPDSVDWGFVTVNTPVIRRVTLTNTGNVAFAGLNLTIQDVQGLTGFDVGWNLEGANLGVGESAVAEFTLEVYSWSSLSFSFDLVVN